jgi:hypothetical protein
VKRGEETAVIDVANSRTRNITIEQSAERVFAYAAEAEHLPEWAPAFAETVRRDGDDIVVTADGTERRFHLLVSPALGVIDFQAVFAPNVRVTGAMLRIVPYEPRSEVLFTLLRLPGEADDAFADRTTIVDQELTALRARVLEVEG